MNNDKFEKWMKDKGYDTCASDIQLALEGAYNYGFAQTKPATKNCKLDNCSVVPVWEITPGVDGDSCVTPYHGDEDGRAAIKIAKDILEQHWDQAESLEDLCVTITMARGEIDIDNLVCEDEENGHLPFFPKEKYK